ncbi:Nuclear receptor-binding protein [Trichinella pseudospiralis]|uniref:Nuclear receptor-binding protein n=1 Tax=Trichinella pseudospiralis TaxID=6337 RepID=A0A0V1EQ24_TRIPS|nr:Nuclear receptor-binding protein [Trichinella pseudospiralis]
MFTNRSCVLPTGVAIVLLAFRLSVCTFFGISNAMCCAEPPMTVYFNGRCVNIKATFLRFCEQREAELSNFMDAIQLRKQSAASLSEDDSDEESDAVLEESPCGRWQKRRERVSQRDVPGIDAAYLAMDTELGVEVVWNEVHFSERRKLRAELQEIRLVFDRLTRLEHPNLIKLHSYWLDTNCDKQRVIFITEYMSSGSMSQFMKRTARGGRALGLKAWKKWCMPVLLALDYLHSFEPPVVHCNLTSDTIFIQQNGLIKIGCVTPYLIHQHVKTYRENIRNLHYIAPEYRRIGDQLSPAVDIYAFGICALEMAVQGVAGTSPDQIQRSLQLIEDDEQRRLISLCLEHDPHVRPSARQLILQPALFEVPSLRLLAAHMVILDYFDWSFADCDARLRKDKTRVLAEIVRPDGESSYRLTEDDMPATDLNKFLEDVRTGVYPLTALKRRPTPAYGTDAGRRGRIENGGPVDGLGVDRSRSRTFHTAAGCAEHRLCNGLAGDDVDEDDFDEEHHVETRQLVDQRAEVRSAAAVANVADAGAESSASSSGATSATNSTASMHLTLQLKYEDSMRRELSCEIADTDTGEALSDELVHYGFIRPNDQHSCAKLITSVVEAYRLNRLSVDDKSG